jgi:hypothetical protein
MTWWDSLEKTEVYTLMAVFLKARKRKLYIFSLNVVSALIIA